MKSVVIIQARMGSTRLPGKVLQRIGQFTLLEHVVRRSLLIPGVDEVVVATSTAAIDDAIESQCTSMAIRCVRGSESDVLARYVLASQLTEADTILRVTADCPLLGWEHAGEVLAVHHRSAADYSHNITVWGGGTPLGTGVEVFSTATLMRCDEAGREPHHREHVTEFVGENPTLFRIVRVPPPPELNRPSYRLTIDTPQDLELIRAIDSRFGSPKEEIPLGAAVDLLDREPALLAINQQVSHPIEQIIIGSESTGESFD